MGEVRPPSRARLICGMISQEAELFEVASQRLATHLGPIDYKSRMLDFDQTDHYETEMGKDLKRRFVSFKRLIDKEKLPSVKLLTNALEKELSKDGRRRINLDPGYLTLSKLVLATTKDYSHRIYLGEGIYGEVTLYYKDKGWRPHEWTYPDYKTSDYLGIFEEIRRIHLNSRKEKLATNRHE